MLDLEDTMLVEHMLSVDICFQVGARVSAQKEKLQWPEGVFIHPSKAGETLSHSLGYHCHGLEMKENSFSP